MNLNNKGFAITGILYTSLLMFVLLLTGIMTMMASRKVILDKTKKEVLSTLNTEGKIYNEYSYLMDDLELIYDGIVNTNKINNLEIEKTVFFDLSGNNNDGTLQSFNYNNNSGWQDNYLKFDGENDVVRTNIDASEFAYANKDFTMSILAKINKVTIIGTSSVPYDASTVFGASYYNGYGIIWNTSDILTDQYNLGAFYRNDKGSSHMFSISTNFDIQQITFVYDLTNNKQQIYVDGNFVEERSAIKEGEFTYPTEMGDIKLGGSRLYGGSAKNVYTDMNLYSARLYTKALTEAEIKREYNIDKYRYGL